MIQSMTGYGKAVVAYKDKKIHVEVKSLNSKQLDLNTRIAPLYREKEMEMRQMVAEALIRGKADMSVWIEKDTLVDATPINAALVENYYQQIQDIAQKTGIPVPEDWFYTLLRMPDVLTKTDMEELEDAEWEAVKGAVQEALKNLVDFRIQEGAALQKKFSEKIDNIERLLGEIEPYEQSRVEKIRQRIIDGLQQIPGVDYDKNRLEQELIYYIEKLDISEEKQRRHDGRACGTRQETWFHCSGNGARDQYHWLEVEPGRDAEHRRQDEGRTGANQGTSTQRIII